MDERTERFMEQYAEDYFVPKVAYELIPINELVCDQKYQRELSKKQVKNTSENFNPYQINPVKVSKRDGKNYVINGQHTMAIVAKISGSEATLVWCMVYEDMNYEQEADIFAEQMKYVRGLSPYDVFNAKIEAGNPDSLMIKTVVESYGLIIGCESKPGMVCAIKALEDIYEKLGIDALSRTMRVCMNTWEGDVKSLSGNMLKGLAILLAAYDDKIKDDIFVEKLSGVSIKELIRNANDRKNGPHGYAEAMFLKYTYKCRTTLSLDILYKFKFKRQKDKERVIDKGLEKVEKYKEENEIISGFVNNGEIIPSEVAGIYQSIMMEQTDEQQEEYQSVQAQ